MARQLELGTDTATIAAVCTAAALAGQRSNAMPSQLPCHARRVSLRDGVPGSRCMVVIRHVGRNGSTPRSALCGMRTVVCGARAAGKPRPDQPHAPVSVQHAGLATFRNTSEFCRHLHHPGRMSARSSISRYFAVRLMVTGGAAGLAPPLRAQ